MLSSTLTRVSGIAACRLGFKFCVPAPAAEVPMGGGALVDASEQGGHPVSLAPNTRGPPMLLGNTAMRRFPRRSCGRGRIDRGDIAGMINICRG